MKIKIRANPRKKSRRRSRGDAGTMRSECSRQPDEPTLTQARGPVDPALLSPENRKAADVPFVLVLPSLLRQAGFAQAGIISGFGQGADLRCQQFEVSDLL